MSKEPRPDPLNSQSELAQTEPAVSPERREAMRKIGRYGAYIAPAMLALLHSRNATACSGC